MSNGSDEIREQKLAPAFAMGFFFCLLPFHLFDAYVCKSVKVQFPKERQFSCANIEHTHDAIAHLWQSVTKEDRIQGLTTTQNRETLYQRWILWFYFKACLLSNIGFWIMQ